MALTSVTRYKLRKLLKYALVTGLVAAVFTLFSGEPFRWYHLAWLLLGLWTGVLEEFLFGRGFRSLAIPLQFLGKAMLVNAFSIGMVALAFAFNGERLLPYLGEGNTVMADVFVQAAFYRLIMRVVVVTTIAILIVQIEELTGRRMFLGFLLGRYETPMASDRVVMTMDLVGSTGLAERLGDLRYFRFLNRTYSLMTDAVLHNEADIHKYIGDEVIFTWTMRSGTRHLNCLDLFFDIQERIAVHANDLQREFGAVPRYRAAVHGGTVITARIGHIKRAIDLSGDLMNSVSRMLGLCKQLDAGLLASSELLERMPGAAERFDIGPEHTLPVKGRRREVHVRTVARRLKVA